MLKHWYLVWVFVAAGNIFSVALHNPMYPVWVHLALAACAGWIAVTEYRKEQS